MFEVCAIQVENGDAILVTYGEREAPHHILIDGGTKASAGTLRSVLSGRRTNGQLRIEVLVVTHYDLDHIEGVIELLRDPPIWLEIIDIWFNGRKHVAGDDLLGHQEGDLLSKLIGSKYRWNKAFDGSEIQATPSHVEMPGGLTIRVLSPDQMGLDSLGEEWPLDGTPLSEAFETEAEADLLGRDDTWPPGQFSEIANKKFSKDTSVPNGSSIALMLEFEGKLVLLAADAFPSVLVDGLKIHFPSQKPEIALLKVSHHGSRRNTDDRFLAAFSCGRFLFSTNGKGHNHPDTTVIARILKHSEDPQLIFNYEQEQTSGWRVVPIGWPSYTTLYPNPTEPFVMVVILP